MKPVRLSLVIALLSIGLISGLRFVSSREAPPPAATIPASASPAPTGSAPVAPAMPLPRPERTEALAPAVPPANAPVATTAGAQDQLLKQARFLGERATPPDAEGKYRKVRLVEVAGAKYPLVRAEEIWRRDAASGRDELQNRTLMVGDHLIVRLADGASSDELLAYLATIGASVRRQVGKSDVFLVSTSAPTLDGYETTLDALRANGAPLAYVEPDYVVHALFTPNDPAYNLLWGLHNVGQSGGVGDADIDAPEAWDIARGSPSVIVGVIDTGIDHSHPDLQANMWTNPGEIPGNGIDDEGNGYIDDVHGWDFVNNDADPTDDHYHGTHCAGTIGAVGDNGLGVAGVCHRVRLMALKFLSASGGGYTSDAVEAVSYATANGADLTSNSWGGGGYSQALKDAIDDALAHDALFVAAAGNASSNNDVYPSYPASYLSANILSVAASSHDDTLAYFSNYGVNSVHLAAPGTSIYSTSPGAGFRYLSGTSMATPHVAGAAALLLSANPALTCREVKDALLGSADAVGALAGKVSSGGRLNIARALIQNAGPYLAVTSVVARDLAAGGEAGDGTINPGEDVELSLTLKNVGSEDAAGAHTTLSILSGATPIELTRAEHAWGTIPAGSIAATAGTPFLLRVSAGASTPHRFVLRFTTTDENGGLWMSEADLTVYTGSELGGRVTALATGQPVAGATVFCRSSGTEQTVTTAADGTYRFKVVDGSHVVGVSAAGYNGSTGPEVTTPPDHDDVDFALGRARLQVSPGRIDSTQFEDVITEHSLDLANIGDSPLTLVIGSTPDASPAAMLMPQVSSSSWERLGARHPSETPPAQPPGGGETAASALPLVEGFESGNFDGWTIGSGAAVREVVATTAAGGVRSFHLHYTDSNDHFTGIQRSLSAGSRPRYASAWIRPGAAGQATGYFVLGDGLTQAIFFFADESGAFYVNADLPGGDNSCRYTPFAWHHIEFRSIDWVARRFDYYVNGALVRASVPFRNSSIGEITRVYLYNFSSDSEAWWDDVHVTDQATAWLRHSPSELTLAPGATAVVTVTLDSTGLGEGTYSARLNLASNDPVNPVTTVPVTLNVTPSPNSPPVAESQSVTIPEDGQALLTLAGSDPDGHALTARITRLPATGSLYQTSDGVTPGALISLAGTSVLHPAWKLIYIPPADAAGQPLASFGFQLADRRSVSPEATVTINVTALNDLPLARDDLASGLPGTAFPAIPVLRNDTDADGDTLVVQSVTQGARGSVSINPDNTLSYTPGASFAEGTDEFTYTAADPQGGTATARVVITLGYLSAGPWPMMGHKPSHDSHYPASLGGRTFFANWTYSFGRALNQASVAEGRVFVSPNIYFNDTYVAAVDLATGLPVWRKTFVTARSITGPSYHDGHIYVQRGNSSDSQVWALKSADGASVWSTPFSAQWEVYQPPTVTPGGVYVNGGYYGGVYGFDRATGGQLFFQSLYQQDGWTPAWYEGVVYTFAGGLFKAHDATAGTVLWSLTVSSSGYSATGTVALSEGRAFVVGSGELICIDLATRAVAWRVAGGFSGAPAVANGTAYALASGCVRSYDAASGVAGRTYPTDTATASYQPIVTNDALLVANSSKTWVFNLATGTLLQSIPYGGILSISDGSLLIAGSDGVLRSYAITGPTRNAPVALAATITGTEDQNLVITLQGTDADNDPLQAIVTSLPATGTLHQTTDGITPGERIVEVPARVTHPGRQVVYRPLPDAFGQNLGSFSFRVNDGALNSAAAVVTINLTNVNDAPLAVADRLRTRPGRAIPAFRPEVNDRDVDNEPLSVVSWTDPARGTVERNPDGSFRYTPAADFIDGTDTFAYTVRDAAGLTSDADITVEVSNAFGRAWPTFGGGPEHTGHYIGSVGAAPLVQRWSFAAGVSVNALAVAEGRVFYTELGNSSNYVYAAALDATTGGEIWRAQFEPGSLNPPSFHRGLLYLQRGKSTQSAGPQLWALDAETGAARWQAPFGAQWEAYLAPAVSDLGVFINGGTYGGLYGFDRLAGTQKFFLSLAQYDRWTPSLYEGGLYSFVAGRFQSHNPATGAVLATLDLGWASGSMSRTVAFADGCAFLVNNSAGGNELIAIDLATNTVRWRVQAAFTGTPAVANGVVYALAGNVVKSYNSSSGLNLGDYAAPAGASLANAPVVSDDLVIAASSGATYFFRLSDRTLLQTLPFGSQAAIADDGVYLACSDNTVRLYAAPVADNHAPVASPLKAGILEESQAMLTLAGTDADGDPLAFVIRTLPVAGTLYQTSDGSTRGAAITRVPVRVADSAGRVIYQAPVDVFGEGVESFTYTAHDFASSSAAASVVIDIAPVNDAPVAVPDLVALRPGEALTGFHPEANDRDADGDALTVVAHTQGASGRVDLAADGSLSYTPAEGFTGGSDRFDYTIADADGVRATATISVVVSRTFGREWPTFGGNAAHTGCLPVRLGAGTFAQRWANNLEQPPLQVAVKGGRVFASFQVYHTASKLVALDAGSGAETWRVNFTGGAYMNPPSAHGDGVFMQYSNSSSSRLYSLDAATGVTRWSSPFAAQWETYLAPAIDESGIYVNGGYYGGLYGFDPGTGAQKFFTSLAQYDDWTPALYGDGLYSFIKGVFSSHNRSTGAVLWSLDFGWNWAGYSMDRTVACADGLAYLINDSVFTPAGDRELIAINLATRAVAWRVRGAFSGSCTPAAAPGVVYAIHGGSSVRAFDAATGRALATYTAPGETALQVQPIVTNDLLFVGSAAKTYVFDLQSRALRQTIPYGGRLSLAGTALYIGSSDNFLRAFALPAQGNTAPVASPLALQTSEDIPLPITLAATDADGDPIAYSVTRLPASGFLYYTADGTTPDAPITKVPAYVPAANPRLIYVPPANRHGAPLGDFAYAASDGESLSAEASVGIEVLPVNDAPAARDDYYTTRPGQLLSPLSLLSNDSDVDGDTLTITAFTQPAAGRVVRNTDGTLRYHPPRGAESGEETFTYTIADPSGVQAVATVRIAVTAANQGSWPTYGNGPGHTGYTSLTFGRAGFEPRWTYVAGANVRPVAVAEGKVFLTAGYYFASDTYAAALDERTGQLLWKRAFGAPFSLNAPTYRNGRVYIQRGNHSSDTQLWAISAADGATVWSAPHSAQWETYLAPLVTDFGIFVNGGSYGGLYGFEVATGAQRFFKSLSQYDDWTPAANASELFSFVAGSFASHDPQTGNVVWSLNLGWGWSGYDMGRSVTLEDRRAFLINNNTTANWDLVAIDLGARAVAWSFNGLYTGTPSVNRGTVYALAGSAVEARLASDGYLVGTYAAGSGVALAGQPVITDDLVFAASSSKTYVFDRHTTALLQILPYGGALCAAGDQLIVSTANGTVAAYGARPAITFAPAGGVFGQPTDVLISARDSAARIHYTTDGSAPDLGSPSIASGARVRIEWTTRLRAISVLGSEVSSIHEASFTLLDSDGDGIPDWWEVSRFGGTDGTAAGRDSDGDGQADRDEFLAGTDPLDIGDAFAIRSMRLGGGGDGASAFAGGPALVISWNSKPDRCYIVESSPDLITWTTAADPLVGTGGELVHEQPLNGPDRVFLRVRVVPRLLESTP